MPLKGSSSLKVCQIIFIVGKNQGTETGLGRKLRASCSDKKMIVMHLGGRSHDSRRRTGGEVRKRTPVDRTIAAVDVIVDDVNATNATIMTGGVIKS